jgi:hypothetical protein
MASRLPTEECIEWPYQNPKTGSGTVYDKGVNKMVIRVAYEENVGPIPRGFLTYATCKNGRCINPAHMTIGRRMA